MKWYDLLAPLYDRAILGMYLPYRRMAVQSSGLKLGDTVLDLGCGSGLNFELVVEQLGPEGTLLGIDFSEKMLDKAREKIADHNWRNVHLLQGDARQTSRADFEALIDRSVQIDCILCTLGLSVFPDWRDVFSRSFELLDRGGRYCVMDLFNEHDSFQTRVVNLLAGSDISRRVWEPLQASCEDYMEERHSVMHGDTVIVASGSKL